MCAVLGVDPLSAFDPDEAVLLVAADDLALSGLVGLNVGVIARRAGVPVVGGVGPRHRVGRWVYVRSLGRDRWLADPGEWLWKKVWLVDACCCLENSRAKKQH